MEKLILQLDNIINNYKSDNIENILSDSEVNNILNKLFSLNIFNEKDICYYSDNILTLQVIKMYASKNKIKINKMINNEEININSCYKLYLNDMEEYEILTKKEQYELIKKIRNGDVIAKNELIEKNLKLVISIASSYCYKVNSSIIDFNDLIQEGNLGLIKAVERFEIEKDTMFSTYAVFWIKSYIEQFIRKNDPIRVPDNRIFKLIRMKKIKKECILENGVLDKEALALKLDITLECLEDLLYIDSLSVVSKDEPIKMDKDGAILLEDMIPSKETPIDESAMNDVIREDIINALTNFSEREQDIIIKYFGLNGNNPMSFDQIGKDYDISRQRVNVIYQKVLKKLKTNKNLLEYYE